MIKQKNVGQWGKRVKTFVRQSFANGHFIDHLQYHDGTCSCDAYKFRGHKCEHVS